VGYHLAQIQKTATPERCRRANLSCDMDSKPSSAFQALIKALVSLRKNKEKRIENKE
jgi:hypothetical protein